MSTDLELYERVLTLGSHLRHPRHGWQPPGILLAINERLDESSQEKAYVSSSARQENLRQLLCGVQDCPRDVCTPAFGCNLCFWLLQPTLITS